jgi:hypothetical protein
VSFLSFFGSYWQEPSPYAALKESRRFVKDFFGDYFLEEREICIATNKRCAPHCHGGAAIER